MTRRRVFRLQVLLLAWMLALALFSATASPVRAQDKPTPEMSEILSNAAREGMRVIVIEPSGDTAPAIGATTPPSAVVTVGGAPRTGISAEAYQKLADDRTLVTQAQVGMTTFRHKLRERLIALPSAIAVSHKVLAENSPTGDPSYFVWIIFWTNVFLGTGFFITRYFYGYRFVYKRFVAMQKDNPQGLLEKLPILVARILFGLVGVALTFIIAGSLGLYFFDAAPNEAAEKTVLIIFATYFGLYVINILWRLILAPYLPAYRIPSFSDADARKLFSWLAVSGSISIISHAYCTWMYELGLSHDVHAVVTSGLTLLSVLLSIATIIANHRAISAAMLGGVARHLATLPSRMAAALWAPLATVYLVLAWVEMTYRLIMQIELGVPLIIGAYTILMSIIVVYGFVVYAIERFFHRRKLVADYNLALAQAAAAEGATDAEQIAPSMTPAPVMRSFEDLAARIAGILALFAGMWALSEIWQVRQMQSMETLIDNTFDVAVVLFIGYVLYEIVRIAIDRKMQEEGGDAAALAPGDEGGEVGSSRLATLLPLFRSILLIIIIVAVTVMALMEMGINVGPIFAGAGIVGIAVGFGAQFLVRDIFSGAFFLIDDAFRKGEYIDTGSVKGTVEKISIRSFQLRHHLGPLHTIPFGEIKNLTNYSRDWVIMKLPLRVTYDTDVGKVRKLVKNLGLELLKDPLIGDQFLQPLKSQGVIEMQDSAMIIRIKFMTKPGDQWLIRQRVYHEIRELFLREGIRFAHREVTVRVAGSETDLERMTPAQRQAIAGAALTQDGADAWDTMPDMADAR